MKNPHARASLIQQAQMNIKQQLLEHPCYGEFFRNMTILTDDPGTIMDAIDRAIGELYLCVAITITGGNAPMLGVEEEWEVIISIIENPVLNRPDTGGTGKTADIVLDAILCATADRTFFTPTSWEFREMPGMAAYFVRGTTNIILKSTTRVCGEKTEEEQQP